MSTMTKEQIKTIQGEIKTKLAELEALFTQHPEISYCVDVQSRISDKTEDYTVGDVYIYGDQLGNAWDESWC